MIYSYAENDDSSLSWETPKTEMLIDFLVFHLHWEPSYVRQRMIPMLSTLYLREMATNPEKSLLYGQYEFHSIHRVKIRYGHQSYVVKWKKACNAASKVTYIASSEESDLNQEEVVEVEEGPIDLLDESDSPQIQVDDGCWFMLTDENMKLVHSAFPEEVQRFLEEKVLLVLLYLNTLSLSLCR